MNKQEYAQFVKKREQHFRSHHDANPGRNFMMHRFRHENSDDLDNYSSNFSKIFPDSPGAAFDTSINDYNCVSKGSDL